MLVSALTNSSVKNQALQFFLKIVVVDLVLVSSYELADIFFCDSLAI